MSGRTHPPMEFIRAYEEATNSHDIVQLTPLIAADDEHAVCRYRFAWSGTVDGQPRTGGGRGTNVLVNRDRTWQMLHEHVST